MAAVPNPLQLRRRAVEALVRELGYVDALRFLRFVGQGAGDYTRDRHAYLPDLSVDELTRRADESIHRQPGA
jgi:hypothetical protein